MESRPTLWERSKGGASVVSNFGTIGLWVWAGGPLVAAILAKWTGGDPSSIKEMFVDESLSLALLTALFFVLFGLVRWRARIDAWVIAKAAADEAIAEAESKAGERVMNAQADCNDRLLKAGLANADQFHSLNNSVSALLQQKADQLSAKIAEHEWERSQKIEALQNEQKCREVLWYGGHLLEAQNGDSVPLVAMVGAVHELLRPLVRLITATRGIREEMQGLANGLPRESPGQWAYNLFEFQDWSHLSNAANGLEEVLNVNHGDPPYQDPRPLLASFYRTYRLWRDQLPQATAAIGCLITELRSYREWAEAEAAFLPAFETKLDNPLLAEVKKVVRAVNSKAGEIPQTLPVLPTIPRLLVAPQDGAS